jgi:hypothetical protein
MGKLKREREVALATDQAMAEDRLGEHDWM